VGLVSPDNTL